MFFSKIDFTMNNNSYSLVEGGLRMEMGQKERKDDERQVEVD